MTKTKKKSATKPNTVTKLQAEIKDLKAKYTNLKFDWEDFTEKYKKLKVEVVELERKNRSLRWEVEQMKVWSASKYDSSAVQGNFSPTSQQSPVVNQKTKSRGVYGLGNRSYHN